MKMKIKNEIAKIITRARTERKKEEKRGRRKREKRSYTGVRLFQLRACLNIA